MVVVFKQETRSGSQTLCSTNQFPVPVRHFYFNLRPRLPFDTGPFHFARKGSSFLLVVSFFLALIECDFFPFDDCSEGSLFFAGGLRLSGQLDFLFLFFPPGSSIPFFAERERLSLIFLLGIMLANWLTPLFFLPLVIPLACSSSPHDPRFFPAVYFCLYFGGPFFRLICPSLFLSSAQTAPGAHGAAGSFYFFGLMVRCVSTSCWPATCLVFHAHVNPFCSVRAPSQLYPLIGLSLFSFFCDSLDQGGSSLPL